MLVFLEIFFRGCASKINPQMLELLLFLNDKDNLKQEKSFKKMYQQL